MVENWWRSNAALLPPVTLVFQISRGERRYGNSKQALVVKIKMVHTQIFKCSATLINIDGGNTVGSTG